MPDADEAERKQSGLCADCVNAQKIRSDRGAEFILCRLSATDPNFPKYPRLPVLDCPGYRPM
jgi:hypothetical protein